MALEPDVRASRLMAAALGLFLWCAFVMASPVFADNRIALVVGETAYRHAPAPPTAANDASDVAATLTELGFQTTLRLDADKRQLDLTLQQFARDAKNADAAIFYYAGHGLQFEKRNYLAPVDAQAIDASGLRAQLTAVDDVKAALSGAKGLKILILDAARENPLAGGQKRAAADAPLLQGLARDEAGVGMIVAFAAKADQTAPEAEGRNSPFTAALIEALKAPGLEVGALFRRVESDVAAATGGAQSPELAMSATPEYYLNPTDTDSVVWSRIRDGRDVTAVEDFIARFPRSALVPDAIARIETIESRKRAPVDVAKAEPDKAREDASAPQVAATSPASEAAKPDLAPAIFPLRRPRAVAVAGRCLRKTCPPGAAPTRAGARARPVLAAPRLVRRNGERCFVFDRPLGCAALAQWRQARAADWQATSSFPATGRDR